VSWANGSKPQTATYVLRGGAVIATLVGNATSYQDSPGGGTWSYTVASTNTVGVYTYGNLNLITPVSVTVAGSPPPPPTEGWTDLTPPAGASVWYVSNSSGNDGNMGTITSPFQNLPFALTKLRDGFADQILLKCGDTFTLTGTITLTKSAKSSNQYMVIGSYGTGPRPKLRFPSSEAFRGNNNSGQHNGMALVGLDLSPTVPGSTVNAPGITLFSTTGNSWDDFLIEDCYISGFTTGIVAQVLVDGQTFSGLKIRRSIICDNDSSGSGHSQGIFLGGARNWLIEECLIDNNARSKNDMFCHNLYVHEWGCKGIFRGNISSRACSHGGQMRPGGLAEYNLFLGNPINFYQGGNSLVEGDTVNTFRFNTTIDSRDINGIDKRGEGFNLAGAVGSIVENNIAADQIHGSEDVIGFSLDGWSGSSFKNNVVYNWWAPGNQGWATDVQFNGGSGNFVFSNNKLHGTHNGMLVRFETAFRGTYDHNSYSTATPDGGVGGYQRFATSAGVGATWAQWQARAGETGSTLGTAPTWDFSVAAYLTSINVSVGGDPLVIYLTQARLQSKQNWKAQLTGKAYNQWAEAKAGITVAP
jgi:hypothetical protein